ncbi:MAG TPA: copper-binding protein [Verrucomicrobiae bacterium]|nr:copper-binding protein [Verrucomicrobiae bacterium]
MKRFVLLLAVLSIAGCNRTPEPAVPAAQAPAPAAAEPASPATPPPAPAESKRATATGVVESIDATAKTITIAHGPVDALGWPGMTMAFQAPNTDLSAIKAGDNVTFEFDSTGMDGTIVSITKQ